MQERIRELCATINAVTMPRESRIPPQSLYSHRFVRCGDMFRLGTRAKLKQ